MAVGSARADLSALQGLSTCPGSQSCPIVERAFDRLPGARPCRRQHRAHRRAPTRTQRAGTGSCDVIYRRSDGLGGAHGAPEPRRHFLTHLWTGLTRNADPTRRPERRTGSLADYTAPTALVPEVHALLCGEGLFCCVWHVRYGLPESCEYFFSVASTVMAKYSTKLRMYTAAQ